LAPPSFELREEPFAVAGGAIEDLRRALAILGPLRDGVRYAAFTDWEVSFHVRTEAPSRADALARAGALVHVRAEAPSRADALAPTGALVHVRATVHLPTWRPPRSADRALVARWERYTAALRRHEMGHVALAKAAGDAVLAGLAELPPGAPAALVTRAAALVTRAAALAVERIRAAERAYDAETRHGAAQGAALLPDETPALRHETAPLRPPPNGPARTEDA
jgi:predicted secreted Zn-dependent protease